MRNRNTGARLQSLSNIPTYYVINVRPY